MTELGTVTAIRRYPVKSMLGEDVREAAVTPAGLEGDRAVAVIDQRTGRVATAKHPRLWRGLLAFTADGHDVNRLAVPPARGRLAEAATARSRKSSRPCPVIGRFC